MGQTAGVFITEKDCWLVSSARDVAVVGLSRRRSEPQRGAREARESARWHLNDNGVSAAMAGRSGWRDGDGPSAAEPSLIDQRNALLGLIGNQSAKITPAQFKGADAIRRLAALGVPPTGGAESDEDIDDAGAAGPAVEGEPQRLHPSASRSDRESRVESLQRRAALYGINGAYASK